MTVGEMEEMLALIEDKDMVVVIECEDGTLRSVCSVNSTLADVAVFDVEDEFLGVEDEDLEQETVLILAHCTCGEEDCELPEIGEINSQPELN